MNKIEIKDLYLVFGPEKQKAFRMLKETLIPQHYYKIFFLST